MKHPFLLWLALLFSLLTATSRADHFKGGTLSWERITTEPGFRVRADITLSFDLSSPTISPEDPETPKVNGHWVYTPGMQMNAGCQIEWGEIPGLAMGVGDFEVVAVDFAAQIVTVKGEATHDYNTDGTYTMAILGNVRDHSEELANRQSQTMRVESTVTVNTTTPSANRPPAFNLGNSKLVIVPRQDPADPAMTFQAPVATDPDGDTVKYSFHLLETHATSTPFPTQDSWEVLEGLTITDAGVISWDTSDIKQTIKTYAIQVVATDYDSNDEPRSSSAIEFQVWVNDPNQDGVPELELAPTFETYTAYPGQLFQFRILGTDYNSEDKAENSRLETRIPSGDMPPGAVLVPSGGFAGEIGGLDDPDHHNDLWMEAVFSWTPASGQANTSWTLHIKVEDDDGHFSTEKIVVINVGPATTLQPLQLTVTGGTEDTDVNGKPVTKIVGRPGTDLTFTVTGSTAVTGADLQLFCFDELPPDSAMTPGLPATGTNGSVQSVFAWDDLTTEDVTLAHEPHEVIFHVADEFGREVSRTVLIYVFPDPPTIALAPGETVPVTKETWKSLSFRYVVTGHDSLDIIPEVGTVDGSFVTAPHTGTLIWRALPGQLVGNTIEVTVRDRYSQQATLSVPVTAVPTSSPAWWATRGVLTGGDADDYAAATQGQLKAIATKAYAEMLAADASLPTLDPEGVALVAYINGFSTTEGNYNPLLQGQLKHGAKLFYDVMAKKTGKDLGLPWTEGDANDDRHYAPANLGHVKALFSFPLPLSTIFNDPPLVTLNTPVHGQTATAPATFALTATASDPDGSIASVTFYNGTTVLSTDTESPYEYSWADVAVGSYNITAKATDNRGAQTTTSVATVSAVPWVDPAPVVTITSPTANQSFGNPANITINATAMDNGTISQVSFYEGSTWIGNDSTPPYSVTWSNVITPGTHQLRVTAYDNLGQGGHATVNITVGPVIPNTTNLTLRNGQNGYTGMVDTMIRSDRQRADFSSHTWIRVDRGYPDSSALLRWDLTKVPANLNVKRVKLVFRVWGKSDKNYEIYASRRYWSPAAACWKEYTYNQQWTTFGAKDIDTDREDEVLGTLYVPEETEGAVNIEVELNEAGVNKVKEWIADSTKGGHDAGFKNYGFIIQDYSGTNDKPLDIGSAEHSLAYRPAMVLYYE